MFQSWIQLKSQICPKFQLGLSMHLKPFSACSCQVVNLFVIITFIFFIFERKGLILGEIKN